ncbi:MAG: reverse transcriptase domain-containing protein, partial [Providencia heimbachae]|nr:reverse transcriptase domain-containing protein [Providencia heimbachae]
CAIFNALKWAGLCDNSIEIIRNLYKDCTTRVRCAEGLTEKIAVEAGVRQGCPLSPIIFNLTMEPLLKAISASEEGYHIRQQKTNVLAYADDIVLIANAENGMKELIQTTEAVAKWSGLLFNGGKCATLHIKNKNVHPTQFIMGNANMKTLGREEHTD